LTDLLSAVKAALAAQSLTGKPLSIIVAGHNGSGKSTLWRKTLSGQFQVPLINADRMMLSILPEPNSDGVLEPWAQNLRDTNQGWMKVSQDGVQSFVGHAMRAKVPFAMETVFSHWVERPDGIVSSKLELIVNLQAAGYFVLLVFVGLSNSELSLLRVRGRVAENGHDVPYNKLIERFPRTQKAIRAATKIADAAILVDNSRSKSEAFTVCQLMLGAKVIYDVRDRPTPVSPAIREWLDIVSPAALT
jgi:predicted ABC-type ATPase